MLRVMLKSKIHRATITGSDLHYVGSITLDADLLEAADMLEHEQVHVLDIDNGARFETYTIAGERGSGVVQINGAAARLVHEGDTVIVISYAHYDETELHHALRLQGPGGAEHHRCDKSAFDPAWQLHFDPPFFDHDCFKPHLNLTAKPCLRHERQRSARRSNGNSQRGLHVFTLTRRALARRPLPAGEATERTPLPLGEGQG